MRYAVITFGCRVNQADSLGLEAELCARGAEPSPVDAADVVFVNTCSVTAGADQGARQAIRRVARDNPRARIVATGCYATRRPDEVSALAGVIAVVPNASKHPAALLARLVEVAPELSLDDGPCGRPIAPGLMGRTAWSLRVQMGCDEACSYCIIPQTRGAGRSRPVDDVRAEVDRVVAAGYKEVVVTGVHLGSYGRDLHPRSSLVELLAALPLDRLLFRVSSLEPMDVPADLFELEIAPHFHLPLQHASNRLLSLMRRPYTLEQYRAMVDRIRRRLPHAAIASDLIVGFPSETDRDFELLASYLLDSPLSHLHVFPYSERPGTVAAALPDKVHGSVVRARSERLREISRVLAARFRDAQRGTARRALTIDGGTMAVTDNYLKVTAPPGIGPNEWVTVSL